ncbi:MAG: hypothetical protein IJX33_02595, partial [Akkermansia sp.]|nr:hypothetical protein [Akkermansia sp.]
LAGWQIRMSVPFMLSIDYLHINAHPYLPPTRSARGSVTIFTLPQGLRPGLLNLPPRQQAGSEFRSPAARQIPIYRDEGLLPERFLEGLGFMGTCVSQNKSLGHVCTETGAGVLSSTTNCVFALVGGITRYN